MELNENERSLLLKVLDRVEWVGTMGVHRDSCCPLCHAPYDWETLSGEHNEGCELERAKNTLGSPVGKGEKVEREYDPEFGDDHVCACETFKEAPNGS